MSNNEEIKNLVREKYNSIATQDTGCGCGCSCGGDDKLSDYTIFSESYDHLEGYLADADLNLGCGLPTEFAQIQPGHHVLDLGSGAGNDCFVARSETGESGRVTGLDFTPGMIEKARQNAAKLNYENVHFIQGDIEKIPLDDLTQDVVISNCVLNLIPDKAGAFNEIYRVLKPGGHFCISDVVTDGRLPEGLIKDAELYAGCVSGALQKEDYLRIIETTGFKNVEIKKDKAIVLPDKMLEKYLNAGEIESFKNSATGIFSITVTAQK
jgi:arsenite methyltransferase